MRPRTRGQPQPMDQFFDILVLNDDVLGYKVTLQPELSNAQYVVKFTPIAASPRRNQVFPNQLSSRQDHSGWQYGRPTQIRRICSDNVFRRHRVERRYPIVETILQAVAEAGRAEQREQAAPAPSSQQVGAQAARRVSERPPPRCRRRSNQRRRRRRRRRGITRRSLEANINRDTDSDESMYEVLDVDYEKITDMGKAEPPKDWRIVPRYELTVKEVAQQERDLFFSMTKDERPEETRKARDGEPSCCVCFDNAATRVVIPCGHRCLCRACALKIATSRSTFGGKRLPKLCPICQAAIAVMPRLC